MSAPADNAGGESHACLLEEMSKTAGASSAASGNAENSPTLGDSSHGPDESGSDGLGADNECIIAEKVQYAHAHVFGWFLQVFPSRSTKTIVSIFFINAGE
jgi:hypothetical protein